MTYKEFMDYLLKRKKPNDTVFDPNTPIENALYETEVEQTVDVFAGSAHSAEDYDDEISNYWNEMLTEQATHNNTRGVITSNKNINLTNYYNTSDKYINIQQLAFKKANEKYFISVSRNFICRYDSNTGTYENILELDLRAYSKIVNKIDYILVPFGINKIYKTGDNGELVEIELKNEINIALNNGNIIATDNGYSATDSEETEPIIKIGDKIEHLEKYIDTLTITIEFTVFKIYYDIYNPNFAYNNSWRTYSHVKASNTINGDNTMNWGWDSVRAGDIPEWSRFPAKYKELDYEYTTKKITTSYGSIKRITRKVKAKIPIFYDYSLGDLNLEGFRLYHLINFLIKLYPDREPEEAIKCLFKYANTNSYTLKIDEHTFGEENLNGLVKTIRGSSVGWDGKIERKVPKYYKTEDRTFITRDYAEYLERQIRKLEVKNGIS